MNRGLRSSWVALSTVVAAVVLAAPAGANTSAIPVAGTEVGVGLLDPGTSWFAGNVAHARDLKVLTSVTGSSYVAGTNTVTINWNLNLVTGAGLLWGTFDVELDAFAGGFAGSWNARFTETGWAGDGVGQGYGELAGWQGRLHLESFGSYDTIDGFVFSPADR